jgi:hypothetical protein
MLLCISDVIMCSVSGGSGCLVFCQLCFVLIARWNHNSNPIQHGAILVDLI